MICHGILTGPEIERRIESGDISITPYRSEQLNPSSYDLTLGPEVIVYDETTLCADTRVGAPMGRRRSIDSDGMFLNPGVGYLMHTIEKIRANNLVAVIDGKSTLGRLFLSVHQTAGYVDPGFDGQYTLEVTVMFPLKVYRAMRIAQVRFHTICGQVALYHGHYVGKAATGSIRADVSGLITKERGRK